MKSRNLDYFKRIAKIETPNPVKGQYQNSYSQMCALYCTMRNTARGVINGNLLEEVGKTTIKGLLKKIKNIKKENLFEK